VVLPGLDSKDIGYLFFPAKYDNSIT